MLKGKNLTKLFRIWVEYGSFTSSRSEAFCKTGVLKNTTKFTEKHTCATVSFLKKRLRKFSFVKRRLWQMYFPVYGVYGYLCVSWFHYAKNTFFFKYFFVDCYPLLS